MNRLITNMHTPFSPRWLRVAAAAAGLTAAVAMADETLDIPLSPPVTNDFLEVDSSGNEFEVDEYAPATARYASKNAPYVDPLPPVFNEVTSPPSEKARSEQFSDGAQSGANGRPLRVAPEPQAAVASPDQRTGHAEVWYGGRRGNRADAGPASYRPAEIWYGVPDAANANASGVRHLPSTHDSTVSEADRQAARNNEQASNDRVAPHAPSIAPNPSVPQPGMHTEASMPFPRSNQPIAWDSLPSAGSVEPDFVDHGGSESGTAQHAFVRNEPISEPAAPSIANRAIATESTPLEFNAAKQSQSVPHELAAGDFQRADDARQSQLAAPAGTIASAIEQAETAFDGNSPLIFFTVGLTFAGPVMLMTCLIALMQIGRSSRERRTSESRQARFETPNWPTAPQAWPPMMPAGWMPYAMPAWGPQAHGMEPARPTAESQPASHGSSAELGADRLSGSATSSRAGAPASGEQAMIQGIFEDNLRIRTRMSGSAGKRS